MGTVTVKKYEVCASERLSADRYYDCQLLCPDCVEVSHVPATILTTSFRVFLKRNWEHLHSAV